MNLPDGRVIEVNDVTGAQRVLNAQTRMDQAIQAQNEESFAAGEAQSAAGNPVIDQASSLLDRFLAPNSQEDFNVGGAFEGFQRLTSPINPFNSKTQSNTDELEQFLNNFTLDKASALSGVLSDRDIALLENTKPTINSQEHLIQKWLYKVTMAERARKQIQEAKRRVVEQYGPMGLSNRDLIDEEKMRADLWSQAEDNYDAWVQERQASGRLGASNHLQRDADSALDRVNAIRTGGGF